MMKRRTIFFFIIAVIAVYVLIEVIPSLTGALTGTETLQYGELKVFDEVEAWVIRDETVYKAAASGKMKGFVEEGALIKNGSKVLELQATGKKDESGSGSSKYSEIISRLGDGLKEDKDQKAQRKGIFSSYVDGYESYFTPKKIDELTYKKTRKVDVKPEDIKRNKTAKGDPIYKIADNSGWYLVFWVPEDDISKYEEGASVNAEFEDESVKGVVKSVDADEKHWKIVIETNRYYERFTQIRKTNVNIVTTDSEGLLISNKCLATKDKKPGCYVKTKTGDYVFKQVQILASDDEQSLVTETQFFDDDGNSIETVKAYDEVLTNPRRSNE